MIVSPPANTPDSYRQKSTVTHKIKACPVLAHSFIITNGCFLGERCPAGFNCVFTARHGFCGSKPVLLLQGLPSN